MLLLLELIGQPLQIFIILSPRAESLACILLFILLYGTQVIVLPSPCQEIDSLAPVMLLLSYLLECEGPSLTGVQNFDTFIYYTLGYIQLKDTELDPQHFSIFQRVVTLHF